MNAEDNLISSQTFLGTKVCVTYHDIPTWGIISCIHNTRYVKNPFGNHAHDLSLEISFFTRFTKTFWAKCSDVFYVAYHNGILHIIVPVLTLLAYIVITSTGSQICCLFEGVPRFREMLFTSCSVVITLGYLLIPSRFSFDSCFFKFKYILCLLKLRAYNCRWLIAVPRLTDTA